MIFDFKNDCKNEFSDNKEKSYSWSINRVSRKIDLKVQWLRNSHADSVGVKVILTFKNINQIEISLKLLHNEVK